MSSKENSLGNKIMRAASKIGGRLFRTNSGRAWGGKRYLVRGGELKGETVIRHPRPIHLLPTGHSDYAGFTVKKVTPEMVGSYLAVYTAVEVKTEGGKESPEQKAFLAMVTRHGGIAVSARGIEDYSDAVAGP